MNTASKLTVALIGLIAFTSSCGTTVSRVDPNTQIDLSGRWNDVDAQKSAHDLIADAIQRPWMSDFMVSQKRKPVVIVGQVRNRTSEHIDTLVITKSLERELINSGRATFVASQNERQELRTEREDQQTESNPATVKRLGMELGADFMLQGTIGSIVDAISGQQVVFYKINLELTNIETNEKVWIGETQIKKVVTRPGSRL